MKLLTENIESVEFVIEEGSEGKKSHFISGVFMQAEQKNRNGRIYPKGILEAQVDNQQRLIKEKKALGELNHPNSPNVNLERASHLITELRWEGNDVYGKAKLLETPMGKIAKTLLDEGVKFGVSTRGMGSVRNKGGINEVQNDFKLVCVDIVSDPSAHNAWVNGIMEGVSTQAEWIFDAIKCEWVISEVKKSLDSTSKLTIEQKFKLMKKLLGI